jgi:hypothetical protein
MECRRSPLFAPAFLALVTACAGTSSPGRDPRPAPPISASAVDAGAPEAQVPEPPTRTPEYPHDEHYPPDAAVVLADWLRAHGVKSAFPERRCWDAGERVGVPPAPGLVCEASTNVPPRTTSRLYRLEGQRLRRVWKGTVKTYANWLELTPVLDPSGSRLVLHEASAGNCDAAQCEYSIKQQSGINAHFGDVLDEGCAQVGTYRWARDRYVRAPELDPPPSVAPPECERFPDEVEP